jgi:hypothetical protein
VKPLVTLARHVAAFLVALDGGTGAFTITLGPSEPFRRAINASPRALTPTLAALWFRLTDTAIHDEVFCVDSRITAAFMRATRLRSLCVSVSGPTAVVSLAV